MTKATYNRKRAELMRQLAALDAHPIDPPAPRPAARGVRVPQWCRPFWERRDGRQHIVYTTAQRRRDRTVATVQPTAATFCGIISAIDRKGKMKYKRKYQTDEERRRAKSEAGRRGAEALKRSGNFRGGRPKGARNKNAPFRFPTRTLTVRQPDYDVIVKMAHAMAVPIVEFLHAAAESWRERNPSLFANDIVLKI